MIISKRNPHPPGPVNIWPVDRPLPAIYQTQAKIIQKTLCLLLFLSTTGARILSCAPPPTMRWWVLHLVHPSCCRLPDRSPAAQVKRSLMGQCSLAGVTAFTLTGSGSAYRSQWGGHRFLTAWLLYSCTQHNSFNTSLNWHATARSPRSFTHTVTSLTHTHCQWYVHKILCRAPEKLSHAHKILFRAHKVLSREHQILSRIHEKRYYFFFFLPHVPLRFPYVPYNSNSPFFHSLWHIIILLFGHIYNYFVIRAHLY